MKDRKFYFLFVMLLSIAFLLTACGGGGEATVQEPDTASITEEVEEVQEEVEEVDGEEETAVSENTITLTVWADENRAGPIQQFASQFESDFGVTLVVEEFGFGDIRDQLTVAGPAGEGADIIVGAHDWLGELVTNGLLAPIDLGDRATEFAPAAIQAFTYNGELYGLPYATENIALFRNPDLVPDAPTTWDEIVEISRELAADNDEDIESNQYGFIIMEGNAYHLFPILTAYGGYVFAQNEDGTYDPTDVGVGDPGSIEGAVFYDTMREDGLIPPSLDGETMVEWFEQGKAAMMVSGPWNLGRIRESGVNYVIDSIPVGTNEARPFLGSQGFMINSFSENPLLAQIFVTEFVASTDLMQAFYEADPRTPAYLPVLSSLENQDVVAFGEAGSNALPMPAIPEMGAVWQSWQNAITLIGQQTEEPESALTTAQEQIRTAISGEDAAEAADPVEIEMVNIPGTAQEFMGCDGNWLPDCAATALTLGDDDLWTGTFNVPAGDYEVKIAINGGWDINYGVDGAANGDNYTFSLADETAVTFTFDSETNLLDIATE